MKSQTRNLVITLTILIFLIAFSSCSIDFLNKCSSKKEKEQTQEQNEEQDDNNPKPISVIFELDSNNKVKISSSSPIPLDGVVTYPSKVGETPVEGLAENGIGSTQASLITSIILPTEIEAIPFNSFQNLTELVCINVLCPTATIEALAFTNCPKLRTIMVPNDDVQISVDSVEDKSKDLRIQVGLNTYTLDYEPTPTTYKSLTDM